MSSWSNLEDILSSNIKTQQRCLDKLVENINENKERTIYGFLKDSGSEDFLWSLVQLLSSEDIRTSSNAAYVIGSLAETELGTDRVLSLTKGKHAASIIKDLTNALTSEDSEYVMNTAGTLGTLAETSEGRDWMLSQPCIDDTLSRITDLLSYENNWVASNAALVLARLTISETGCNQVLQHENSSHILTKLILSLGNDVAGRGMNAAFAIGRLLDMAPGKERLLNFPETEKMISTLCRMLCKGDMGSAKNACFAVSRLAADEDGNHRILTSSLFTDVLGRLVILLSNEDDLEAAWFSAMTLRTLSSHQKGVLKLREAESVISALNKNYQKSINTKELNEEIENTLEHLKRLDAPNPPVISNVSATSVRATWDQITTKSGMAITYKLFEGSRAVYKGKDTEAVVDSLTPNTTYHFKMKVSAVGDESPFSDIVSITTEEGCPTAPCCLHVVGATPNQIRITWNKPERSNGALRGYSVYLGEKLLDCTNETSFIFGRLHPSTSYTIHVCASTAKGLSERASVSAHTEELGAHAPGRPSVTVIGRNEVHVTWNPPAVPLGRFFRYELSANKEVIYSGTDRSFYATNLLPDKDYSFTVCAITSEGRCESDPTKKRTHKDKSQVEPGRHASKTHSFKAKIYQLEKAKTQSSIVRPKQKIKKPGMRPNSCVSSVSEKSRKLDRKLVPSTDGSWAADRPITVSTDVTDTSDSKTDSSTKYASASNAAALGGALMKVDIKPAAPSAGKGNLSMFLQKSRSEYPLRLKLTDKNSTTTNKLTIEPISLEEMFSTEGSQSTYLEAKRQSSLKPKSKRLPKFESSENEKAFISLITQTRSQKTNLPKMTFVDQFNQEKTNNGFVNNHHTDTHKTVKDKQSSRVKKRAFRRYQSPAPSDSSSDDFNSRPEPPAKNVSLKAEPLTLADVVAQSCITAKPTTEHRVVLDDPRQMVARLRTPSKGYWSDHDVHPTSKKNNGLAPINYKTFRGAHRPIKTLRQESPLVTDTWLSELPMKGEKNKYKFIPTQLRTQPLHLPRPGRLGRRLESLTQLDLRQDSTQRFVKSSYYHDNHEASFQRSFDSALPRKTRTFVLREGAKPPHGTNFKPNLLHGNGRSSPHQRVAMAHGDAV